MKSVKIVLELECTVFTTVIIVSVGHLGQFSHSGRRSSRQLSVQREEMSRHRRETSQLMKRSLTHGILASQVGARVNIQSFETTNAKGLLEIMPEPEQHE